VVAFLLPLLLVGVVVSVLLFRAFLLLRFRWLAVVLGAWWDVMVLLPLWLVVLVA